MQSTIDRSTAVRPHFVVSPSESLSGHQLYIERIERHNLPYKWQDKVDHYETFYAVRNHDAAGVVFFFLATQHDRGRVMDTVRAGEKGILYRNGREYISGVTCKAKSLTELAYLGQKFGWLCTDE